MPRRGRSRGRVDIEPDYNRLSTKSRCELYVPLCLEYCKDPTYHMCYKYLELVQGCNNEYLDGLPPPRPGFKPPNRVPPFVMREVRFCRFIKELLVECREKNSNYDADWKCAPFEGYVDECIAQNLE